MGALLPWLPTIVAMITAALALGGSRNKLDTIETLIKEVRGESKDLAARVHEVLTAKAVTAAELAALRSDHASLRAECERRRDEVAALSSELHAMADRLRSEIATMAATERDLRHKLAESVNATIRELELSLRDRHP